jgi:hypothetical protein
MSVNNGHAIPKGGSLSEEPDRIAVFIDCVAGCIVIERITGGKWRLNMPRVAAVGETLGIAPEDLDQGGKHYDDLMARESFFGLTIATKRDARLTAEKLFGPKGELAPDFLCKR